MHQLPYGQFISLCLELNVGVGLLSFFFKSWARTQGGNLHSVIIGACRNLLKKKQWSAFLFAFLNFCSFTVHILLALKRKESYKHSHLHFLSFFTKKRILKNLPHVWLKSQNSFCDKHSYLIEFTTTPSKGGGKRRIKKNTGRERNMSHSYAPNTPHSSSASAW